MRIFGFLILAVLWLSGTSRILPAAEAAKLLVVPPAMDKSEKVVSQHDIAMGNAHLAYTATAGFLTLWKDPDASPHVAKGRIFYIAYVRKGDDPATRPIAFCFNGGPGSASTWLNLGLGPRRVDLPDNGTDVAPPYRLVDNAETWLDKTDLVFVDPIPTGYSRPASGTEAADFEGYQNDLGAMTEFIRSYVGDNSRWLSPKILVGESYGTVRVAGLAAMLTDKTQIAVNGIILMSQALNCENDYGDSMRLPSYAAAAWYHGKIGARYRSLTVEEVCAQAETFVRDEYAPALFQGDALPKEKSQRIAEELSAFTGVEPDDFLQSSLEFPRNWQQKMLHSETHKLAIYDARGVQAMSAYSPVSNAPANAMGAAFSAYVSDELGFHAETPYHLLASVNWGDSGSRYYDNFSILQRDLNQNPNLKILITAGRYDLITPYYAAKFGVDHLHLDPSLRSHIEIDLYPSGHMPYVDKASRLLLKTDFDRWMDGLKT